MNSNICLPLLIFVRGLHWYRGRRKEFVIGEEKKIVEEEKEVEEYFSAVLRRKKDLSHYAWEK